MTIARTASSEIRDGMRVDWDVAITMDDGIVVPPGDRSQALFGGQTTLHTGPQHAAYVLLPVIPLQEESK